MDCFVGSHHKLLVLSSAIAHVLKRPKVITLLTPYSIIYGASLLNIVLSIWKFQHRI